MHHIDSYFEKLDYKKIAILLVICGISLCIFLVVSFISSSRSKSPITNTTPTQSPDDNAQNTTPTQQTKNELATFTGIQFSFQYPSHWKIDMNGNVPNGQYIRIRPQSVPANDYLPFIIIRSETAQGSDPVSTVLDTLNSQLHFPKKTVQFQGIAATEIDGTIPGKSFSTGNPTHTDAVERTLFFVKGNTLYMIEGGFYSDVSLNQNEALFNQFLSSVKLI